MTIPAPAVESAIDPVTDPVITAFSVVTAAIQMIFDPITAPIQARVGAIPSSIRAALFLLPPLGHSWKAVRFAAVEVSG